MSRFGYRETFSSKRSAQECAKATLDVLASIGCNPHADLDGTEITCKVGMGWAIRLIGGWEEDARSVRRAWEADHSSPQDLSRVIWYDRARFPER